MDLEDIRRKKLEELQRQSEEQQKYETARKQLFQQLLTKEARERLNNVRVAHPELAQKVELAIVQAVQSGQVKNVIDDELVKHLLISLQPKKRDFKITRK